MSMWVKSIPPLRQAASSVAVGGLAAHLVLTAIDNLPDQHVSVRELTHSLLDMPTWRFFGPNPGVDDTHLFWRHARDDTPLGEWEELNLTVQRPWWAPLWNPGTRAPKTLFDAAQQVKLAAAQLNGDFTALTETPGYRLLEDYVRSVVPRDDIADQAQFLLLTTRPMPGTSTLSPVMTSRFFAL